MTKGKNDHPQAYGDEKYWDSRYENDAGSFDWYQRFTGLSSLINKYIPRSCRVLMVGCGNAAISEDMVNDGYQDVVNVDISSVVIDAMQKKYLDVPQLSYIRLDVRDMRIFKDAMFEAVIDKGMFDSLMCGPSAPYSTGQMLEEVHSTYVEKRSAIYRLPPGICCLPCYLLRTLSSCPSLGSIVQGLLKMLEEF